MIRLLTIQLLLVQSLGFEPGFSNVNMGDASLLQRPAPQVTMSGLVPAAPAQRAQPAPAVAVAVAAQPVPAVAAQPVVEVVAQTKAASNAANAAVAANVAASAANAAVVAANSAATAAASANVAATVAASANAASKYVAPTANSIANAAASASTAANAAASATNAAARANIAADAAASANIAATVAANENIATANAAAAATSLAKTPIGGVVNLQPPADAWSTSSFIIMQIQGLFGGLTFAMFIKALCVMGNVLVQVSPIPSVKRWEARGCTGEADAAPYVSIAFGGCQWCFYGILAWLVTARSGFLILVHSNCLGAVLGTYYVMTYLRNCRCEDNLRSLHKYLSAVASLALLQVCAMSVLPAERALFLIGIISSFCSFINATSVLITLPTVIRTKDSRSIPGPYAIANLLSSMVWSLCGFILSDPCVMMPNCFSTCCAATSLALKVIYPSKEDEKLILVEEGKSKDKALVPLTLPKELTPMMKPTASKTNAGTFQVATPALSSKIDAGLLKAARKMEFDSVPEDGVTRSVSKLSAEGTGGTGGCDW